MFDAKIGKHLSVERIRQLIEDLPDDLSLSVNFVGNLAICRKEADELRCVGFIDFSGDGEIERLG
jgi:hypothetical protein